MDAEMMVAEGMRCSFCGKAADEVRKLIAGPSVFICDKCVGICRDIIAEESAGSAESVADSTAGLRPAATDYAPFYASYVSHVSETNVLPVLDEQVSQLRRVAAQVTAERETFRYAPDKWSVREVFGHLIDAERVFGYRVFCISHGEQQSLPGFDENEYMARSSAGGCGLPDLVDEFEIVREANLAVMRRLDRDAWSRVGNTNGHPVSVLALAFVMAGHVRHHMRVLHERYELP